ncbi:hypothetical protein AB1Y20_010349 [Prymnesium parvum]|uniref:RING-type E3 ubiquitin transferase n=1 Tax=Prymnesium parvum TaxID=97485 RepID=A0AB34K978_PRYPA
MLAALASCAGAAMTGCLFLLAACRRYLDPRWSDSSCCAAPSPSRVAPLHAPPAQLSDGVQPFAQSSPRHEGAHSLPQREGVQAFVQEGEPPAHAPAHREQYRVEELQPASEEMALAHAVEQSIMMSVLGLPIRTWGSVLKEKNYEEASEEECSLCMDILSTFDSVRQLPCRHAFHQPCIDKWFIEGQAGKHRTCPLCAGSAIL